MMNEETLRNMEKLRRAMVVIDQRYPNAPIRVLQSFLVIASYGAEGCTVSDIAKAIDKTLTVASHHTDRLMKLGLVHKELDENHQARGSQKKVTLTLKGKEMLDEIDRAMSSEDI